MLIDTSILIDHLRGRREAHQFLQVQLASGILETSVVAAAELLTGARNLREQREIDRLLTAFRIHPIQGSDGDASIGLLRQHRLSHGIGWLDCLIATAAMRLQRPVATLNDRHFAVIPGLAVIRPY